MSIFSKKNGEDFYKKGLFYAVAENYKEAEKFLKLLKNYRHKAAHLKPS